MDIRRIALITALTLFSSLSFSETCPSVADIKEDKLAGWQIVDSDDAKPLDTKRADAFKKSIVEFLLAEWQGERSKGAVHCYYRDQDGANMEAYLIKNNLNPNNSKHYWYQVSGFMHCAASMGNCQFKRLTTPHHQLASN